MPRKSTAKKKNSRGARKARRAPPAPPSPKQNASPPSAACYVTVTRSRVAIARGKPPTGNAATPCNGFEQAKSTVIDALLAAIEDAERQLAACKRATTIEQLEAV